ncbi:MAG TPA: ABC transporter substrate-binding protein [candidate division Zixibacteria bacterium]|nr:ABC transporter substrate-binding protein [candidate division Zixibacteria bacterium]
MLASGRLRVFALLLVSASQLAIGPQKRLYRLALVIDERPVRVQPQEQGLRDGLEELGYTRGQNLAIDWIHGPEPERLRSAVSAYLAGHRADLLVTMGTLETKAALSSTSTVPILFVPAANPVLSGLVKSLASPGANATGLAFFTGPENVVKQIEVFKHVAPDMRRTLALSDVRDPASARIVDRIRLMVPRLGVELVHRPIEAMASAVAAVDALPRREHGWSVFTICSGLFKDLRALAAAALKQRRPFFGCNAFQVAEQDVFLSYAPDLYSIGYRAAWFADQIFRGTKPGSLSVERPARFDLSVNRRIASAIGLKIAPEVLMLADRVFD